MLGQLLRVMPAAMVALLWSFPVGRCMQAEVTGKGVLAVQPALPPPVLQLLQPALLVLRAPVAVVFAREPALLLL